MTTYFVGDNWKNGAMPKANDFINNNTWTTDWSSAPNPNSPKITRYGNIIDSVNPGDTLILKHYNMDNDNTSILAVGKVINNSKQGINSIIEIKWLDLRNLNITIHKKISTTIKEA